MRLDDAERCARGLVTLLAPYCERIEVAGSIRRRKAEPKDIEIVCVPKIVTVVVGVEQPTMFGPATRTVQYNALDEEIARWLDDGTARPRLDKNDHQALGPSYKRLVVDYGEPGHESMLAVALDLFSVIAPAQWGLILMIRTGSGVGPGRRPETGFGPAMLARWKVVSGGGRSEGGCLRMPSGTPVETPTEQDVFDACRVAFVPPEQRTDANALRRNERRDER